MYFLFIFTTLLLTRKLTEQPPLVEPVLQVVTSSGEARWETNVI